jgi:high-affinity K+ transport system ATPase subunit B
MEKTCTEKDGTAMKLRSPARFRRKTPNQIPFRIVLIVPFFLILSIAVGLIGSLAHYNSRAVVTVSMGLATTIPGSNGTELSLVGSAHPTADQGFRRSARVDLHLFQCHSWL